MLDRILDKKREEIEELICIRPDLLVPFEQRAVDKREVPSYSFLHALQEPNRRSGLIAEVKKASPSKGVIREDFDPVFIAQAYERAEADCLSVLTDQQYFQGSPDFIAQIKEKVKLPVLRKDFIIDKIQINESIELGADAILLIAKALTIEELHEYYLYAAELGLDCLVEIHDVIELESLLEQFTPQIIGINNRNLATFHTDISVTKQLLPYIPNGVTVISESGIYSADMVRDLEACGVNGFLVGEHFMRQDNVEEAVRRLYV